MSRLAALAHYAFSSPALTPASPIHPRAALRSDFAEITMAQQECVVSVLMSVL